VSRPCHHLLGSVVNAAEEHAVISHQPNNRVWLTLEGHRLHATPHDMLGELRDVVVVVAIRRKRIRELVQLLRVALHMQYRPACLNWANPCASYGALALNLHVAWRNRIIASVAPLKDVFSRRGSNEQRIVMGRHPHDE